MQCVCVVCGGDCVGGLWGVWMGHEGGVADPPHPHHGHLWCVLVEVVGGSCDKCCGCVRVCESGAAACWGMRRSIAGSPAISSALQGRIRPPPCPSSQKRRPPTDTTVSGGIGARWGSHPHPLLMAGQHLPASAGAQNFGGISFSGAWCDQAAPTGNQIS